MTVPEGADVIDGNGAHLMPGLADMHTHLSADSDPDYIRLYLVQGVTTLRNLNGLPVQRVAMRLGASTPPLCHLANHFMEEWSFAEANGATQITRAFALFPNMLQLARCSG